MKMRPKKSMLALAIGMLLCAPAAARPVANIDATDPSVLLNMVKGIGFGELDKDNQGDPLVRGKLEGVNYLMFFMDCTQNKNCLAVQFFASWTGVGVTPEQIAGWNIDKRFVKAWIGKTGDPAVVMDVNLTNGISAANFEDTLGIWQSQLRSFKTDVVDQAKPQHSADAAR